jgi:hypothetical protein
MRRDVIEPLYAGYHRDEISKNIYAIHLYNFYSYELKQNIMHVWKSKVSIVWMKSDTDYRDNNWIINKRQTACRNKSIMCQLSITTHCRMNSTSNDIAKLIKSFTYCFPFNELNMYANGKVSKACVCECN